MPSPRARSWHDRQQHRGSAQVLLQLDRKVQPRGRRRQHLCDENRRFTCQVLEPGAGTIDNNIGVAHRYSCNLTVKSSPAVEGDSTSAMKIGASHAKSSSPELARSTTTSG